MLEKEQQVKSREYEMKKMVWEKINRRNTQGINKVKVVKLKRLVKLLDL